MLHFIHLIRQKGMKKLMQTRPPITRTVRIVSIRIAQVTALKWVLLCNIFCNLFCFCNNSKCFLLVEYFFFFFFFKNF
jgi:hypothetical protein